MAPSNSLQIPNAIDSTTASSGTPSSRHYNTSNGSPNTNTGARPTSVAVPSSTAPPSSASSSRRQRASHTVVSPTQHHHQQHHHHSQRDPSQDPSSPSSAVPPTPSSQPFADVYSHPAATLGEGEFGKVKLGLHSQWGEEVAVKLIRRGNVDSTLRMSKVEREIEVLKTLKHPNIVRLYDVIETDKYIGIILEYASGGELFDHILAHRYLKEKDAAKLFSQLISGVWYIHQKKIVHRDLKLENLLLDRNRNVIITDFGFANRFEHKADDLMQTSCGSPCYAAPELVISEGLYVGSAVDIWSCGVILYAMLAGYLPFDDDPANPDGDNINLLYKYIVSTPLSFPEYISAEARDLLSMMLVPDPTRRTSLDGVMRHPWLAAWRGQERRDGVPAAFGRSVDELERWAMELHQQKRLAYQRQMRASAQAQQHGGSGASAGHQSMQSQIQYQSQPQPSQQQQTAAGATRHRRSQPQPLPIPPHRRSHIPIPGRSHSTQPEYHSTPPQPEYLYDSSADQNVSLLSSPLYPQALGLNDDDPFAAPSHSSASASASAANNATADNGMTALSPAPPSSAASANAKGHKSTNSGSGVQGVGSDIRFKWSMMNLEADVGVAQVPGQQGPGSPPKEVHAQREKERRPSQSGGKPLPASPPSSSSATQATTATATTAQLKDLLKTRTTLVLLLSLPYFGISNDDDDEETC
ncbi:kinase-like domain-containing protein [Gymnopilus junonius]|uniref:Kinase-like domain-containing protein n=1 Tax=Gymnopilus junonius TaxID=109634 RepID=A0A9P5NU59_GYMJU|nr:kinase-like domain-containing protein [Gymnopilus junonius]